MIIDKDEPQIIAYGRMKNRRPMVRVVLFMVALLVIVAVLTIARGFIFDETGSSRYDVDKFAEIEKESENVNKGMDKVVITKKKGEPARFDFEEINYDISGLLQSEMIRDLPEKSIVSLRLGGEYYTISKDSIIRGRPTNPDLTILLPLNYANQISNGLCGMIKSANTNGDLGIEMHSSKTSLMWKYRGMLKYRNCLS